MNKLLIVIIFSITFFSCNDDQINVPKVGSSPYDFNNARIELISNGEINIGYITINQLGYVICDSIRITYDNFSKDYSFIGSIQSDSSISIIITPKDTTANDKIKFTAKQTGVMTTGSLQYCNDHSNCEFTEIGHIVGFFTNRFEGFYYTPLFLGEYYVYPL